MFTVCACLPLISITSHSLPPSLPPLMFTHISHFHRLRLLSFSFPPSSRYRRCDPPHITHHELLRWNPALLCCPTNHRPSLLLCFLSSYPLSPLYWWFCLISTSGSRSYHRFLRVTWDLVLFSPTLLELILRNFSHCNPEAHACLVTAGGRVLEDRLTAHIHIQILQYLAGVEPS